MSYLGLTKRLGLRKKLGLGGSNLSAGVGVPAVPSGFQLLKGGDGLYLKGADGAFLYGKAA